MSRFVVAGVRTATLDQANLKRCWLRMTWAALALLAVVGAARGQQMVFSTHDWRDNPAGPTPEAWADVKTPGDGRTYSVGTALITNTNPQVALLRFSGRPVDPPQEPGFFAAGPRYVAVLQVADPTQPAGIRAQAYFFGRTPGQISGGLSTMARAIAVAVGANEDDTRIAICGETFDEALPRAQGTGFTTATSNFSNGFIAVYDGRARLLWSRHLAIDSGGEMSVTDLAIAIDPVTGNDVVTYCGMCEKGNQQPASPQSFPTQGFIIAGASLPSPTDVFNTGNLTVPAGQWDGFVGRVVCPHTAPAAPNPPTLPTQVFHSVVGGVHKEALFGLAMISPDRFAVVGVLETEPATTGGFAFPLTHATFQGPNTQNPQPFTQTSSTGNPQSRAFGTLCVFDAAQTPGGPVILEWSTLIGGNGVAVASIARDVTFQGGRLYVVGATNDAALASAFPTSFRPGMNGSALRGFVVAAVPSSPIFLHASFVGDSSATSEFSATGVAGWPEFPDHVAVTGWRRTAATAPRHIYVATMFADTSTGTFSEIDLLRDTVINEASVGIETPGTSESPWPSATSTFNLVASVAMLAVAEDAAGAIAVDERGLVTVVGSNVGSTDFPVTATGRPPQNMHAGEPDCIRARIAMLPLGVCTTECREVCTNIWAMAPGFNGGTTFSCPQLQGVNRILMDYEGPAPLSAAANSNAVAVVVDQPPSGLIQGGIIQIGIPLSTPALVFGAVERWTNGTQELLLVLANNGGSLRQPLPPLPVGPFSFSLQFFTLMAAPVCGSTTVVGSPALIVSY